MELLRVATAGSVDDGKSTLIGRLLFDSKQIFEDPWEAVERLHRPGLGLHQPGPAHRRPAGRAGAGHHHRRRLPLLRHARRKFIIADTPGHVQYTRNMVTGASTADLALILVDARKGILEQTRRHAFLATLLRVPHRAVREQDGPGRLQPGGLRAHPGRVPGLRQPAGDRRPVVRAGVGAARATTSSTGRRTCPGTEGAPLLQVPGGGAHRLRRESGRLPLPGAVRDPARCPTTHHDYRGYAGPVAGGVFKPGDEVVVLPSGLTSTIASIDTFDGPVEQAFPHMSVTMRLADDIDVSRGVDDLPAPTIRRAPARTSTP